MKMVSKHRQNAQRHTSVPQSHVCVLWLPEVGMMLSPKKYVPLRTKVLEMNSKSLEVDALTIPRTYGT